VWSRVRLSFSKTLAGHGHAKITDLAYGLTSERLTRDRFAPPEIAKTDQSGGIDSFSVVLGSLPSVVPLHWTKVSPSN
jgi:hypothetical protein